MERWPPGAAARPGSSGACWRSTSRPLRCCWCRPTRPPRAGCATGAVGSGWFGDSCPVDGEPTRATPDVIDDMATQVLDAGGWVEHVHADTPLHAHTVAALLRFPVPRPDGPR